MNMIDIPNLTDKIRFIGRQNELQRLESYLLKRGETHIVYYWANGGFGKTRLLKELEKLVLKHGPGIHSTGTIDLYHTDNHGSSDIERFIVQGLDPDRKFFKTFREKRAQYELLRERGANPTVLEKRRAELSNIFVSEIRQMALEVHKLVICFDTLEQIQYESSIIEQEAGLNTVDTRIRSWILGNLKEVRNALIVFAGRPKLGESDQAISPQKRLEEDLKNSFGDTLDIIKLQPFNLAETHEFFAELPESKEYIDPSLVPVIHALTGGRPILLHLVYDLLRVLSVEPRQVYEMFECQRHLVGRADDDPELQAARMAIEHEIIRTMYASGELGEYLFRFALMPKGIDEDLVREYTGLPDQEVRKLLKKIEDLSFIKEHRSRLYFHDEMYRLLTDPKVIHNVRLNEIQAAHTLITRYYTPRIDVLVKQLAAVKDPTERISIRDSLHKLQAERLYYLLVKDAKAGYEEYKKLVAQANAQRWVGFGMRLLDEFLRFYNPDAHRNQMHWVGITHDQVIRESTLMWIERFHWWARYEEEIDFAKKVLANPANFRIEPEHRAILGNIIALKVRAQSMLYGFDEAGMQEAKAMLDQLPTVDQCDADELLARGRLGTSIGFNARKGSLIDEACQYYNDALRSFRRLGTYPDELAIVLNNMTYVYGRRGQKELARIFGHEAMKLNTPQRGDYSLGLTYTNLAAVERFAGENYQRAFEYSETACKLFQELEDHYGLVRAYVHMGGALRELADQDIWSDNLSEAEDKLNLAIKLLKEGIEEAKTGSLVSDIPELEVELGKVCRSLGCLQMSTKGREEAETAFIDGEHYFQKGLEYQGWPVVEQADVKGDIAELYFMMGNSKKAMEHLIGIEEMIIHQVGPQIIIDPCQPAPGPEIPNYYFWPLGKVERLRGELAFTRGDHLGAGEHLFKAYAYFDRFAKKAVEKGIMLNSFYRSYLSDLGYDKSREFIEHLDTWMSGFEYKLGGADMSPLINDLHELLGD